MDPELHISKLDAARRQLEVAIRLYFSEDDPVSIHTLTAAAHQVISDINKARGGTPLLKDTILQYVRPGKVEEARRLVNAAANFFKHSDRDAGETLVFKPSQTEVLLMDACLKYKELTGEIVPTLGVYQAWFWLGPGSDIVDITKARIVDRLRASFPGATRRSFFNETLPMVATIES
jgi:hypothetical protein